MLGKNHTICKEEGTECKKMYFWCYRELLKKNVSVQMEGSISSFLSAGRWPILKIVNNTKNGTAK